MRIFDKIQHSRLKKMSGDDIYKKVISKKKKDIKILPASLDDDYYVTKLNIHGCYCFNFTPKKNYCGKFIFYVYGSDFSFEMSKAEWKFILDISSRTGMGLVIPMYPLCPEFDCRDAINMIIAAYKDMSKNSNIDMITVMGEGTGAGLALSLMIQIWKEGMRKPGKLVLLSPILDTEFFDVALENRMKGLYFGNDSFYSNGVKEFLNQYWVKELATQIDYTSPIYGDLTDLCDDILVISGTHDVFNCYARRFYSKANANGTPAKYFEYRNMPRSFYQTLYYSESVHARKVMIDMLTERKNQIFDKYLYEVKQHAEWTKKFPDVFTDPIAVKYVCNNKVSYEKYRTQSDYHKLLAAARQRGLDDSVKKFLMEYPNGTVVYIGCSLDTMFERVDNGRVLWYNCDSPGRIAVRRIYVSDKERERTIDKSINDRTWMNQVKCRMNQGLLFVCSDILAYYKQEEAKEFMSRLYEKFEGCQVIFDVASYRSMVFTNVYNRGKEADYRKRRLYMNEPKKTIEVWNTAYRVINEKTILDNIDIDSNWSPMLKIKFRYVRYCKDYKIVHIRLGNEKYQIVS